MEPIVLNLLNVNVVVTPELKPDGSFSLMISYDKKDLDKQGVTEEEIKEELVKYIGK